MIEEPYRWVEAIATRRDYIEMQLATGSPVVALGYDEGILLLTVGQQKLFEITIGLRSAPSGTRGTSNVCGWPRLSLPAPKDSPARLRMFPCVVSPITR